MLIGQLKVWGLYYHKSQEDMNKLLLIASKGLLPIQCCFHPMEGECYALIWCIMYLRQYFYQTSFLLQTNHKPLEWLTIVLDAYGRKGH
jgi:hypothetical protein